MTLLELITHLQKLVAENPEALKMEVYGCNGASGAADPMSTPFIRTVDDWTDGVDLPEGTKYVEFYMGY